MQAAWLRFGVCGNFPDLSHAYAGMPQQLNQSHTGPGGAPADRLENPLPCDVFGNWRRRSGMQCSSTVLSASAGVHGTLVCHPLLLSAGLQQQSEWLTTWLHCRQAAM